MHQPLEYKPEQALIAVNDLKKKTFGDQNFVCEFLRELQTCHKPRDH